jgi:Asp/Glu/hydantoin racemase
LIIAVVPSPLMGVICAAVLAALMYGSSVALPVTRSRYVHVVNRLRIQQRGNHFHG